MIESWVFYMRGLCHLLSEGERLALRAHLVHRARSVVETACGQQKKKSKVSRQKEDVLLKLERAFDL
jgi:hypothetical protein